jgi:amino acid transporter
LAWFSALFTSHLLLLIAFMMTVMGDPVSSVAYAIQAALASLNGDLGLLFRTRGLVVAVIAVVVVNYLQIAARLPDGGGAAAAAGRAFGEGWAFVPIRSLVVDYALTTSISISAGASAIVAYLPTLAPARTALALGLLLLVVGVSWYGHLARVAFGAMTAIFVAASALVLLGSVGARPARAPTAQGTTSAHPWLAPNLQAERTSLRYCCNSCVCCHRTGEPC